jgi:hypothetical protein
MVMQNDLRQRETILYIARRHKIVLFFQVLLPALIAAGSLAILWARIDYVASFQLFEVDPVALGLVGLIALMLLIIVYLYVDWRSSQMVLTNQRVIFTQDKPLIRRIQEQLPINDIHQVEAVTSSYPKHWLKFGSIEIQSAAFTRSIIFRGVNNPQDFQDRVMRLIEGLKQDNVRDYDFDDMVNRRIFQDEPPQHDPEPVVPHRSTPHILSWLFAENPLYDSESRSYTWHPHWFFLVKSLFKPFLLLLLLLAVITGSFFGGIINTIWIIGLSLVLAVIVLGWSAWKIEDHRNDRYILTPSQVIDIEKLPFGPENQSTAGLDSIQNVTYKTTLFSRIVGYGDIWLELAGSGDRLTFYNVPHPAYVVSIIDNYQGAFNRSEKERNMEDSLKLLHSYHDLHQEQHDAIEEDSISSAQNGHHAEQPAPPSATDAATPNQDDALLNKLLQREISA